MTSSLDRLCRDISKQKVEFVLEKRGGSANPHKRKNSGKSMPKEQLVTEMYNSKANANKFNMPCSLSTAQSLENSF